MEFTTAQIKDFAIEEEVFEKGKQLMEENAIVSLDIDDFSNDKIILINATVKDQKHYYEVNMSVDKDDYLVRAHICNCPAHQKNFAFWMHLQRSMDLIWTRLLKIIQRKFMTC